MVVPEEFQSSITCAMHGQAYLAETAIGRDLATTDRIKVVCTHREPHGPPMAVKLASGRSRREAVDRTCHGGNLGQACVALEFLFGVAY
jgi:hypothetical protein